MGAADELCRKLILPVPYSNQTQHEKRQLGASAPGCLFALDQNILHAARRLRHWPLTLCAMRSMSRMLTP